MTKTPCKELGSCHSLPRFCPSCARAAQARYPFAPGVIEGPPPPESQGFPVVEAVLALVCVAAVVAVVGFAFGYFNVPGVLL